MKNIESILMAFLNSPSQKSMLTYVLHPPKYIYKKCHDTPFSLLLGLILYISHPTFRGLILRI